MPLEDFGQNILAPRFLDEPNRFPVNQGNGNETASDTLSTTEGPLVSATFGRPLRSTSKVLIMASCQVNNDAATARQVTLRIRRGGSGDATDFTSVGGISWVQKLQAASDDRDIVSIIITDSPASTGTSTYGLWALTDAGSPTATNKAISVLELPSVPKFG